MVAAVPWAPPGQLFQSQGAVRLVERLGPPARRSENAAGGVLRAPSGGHWFHTVAWARDLTSADSYQAGRQPDWASLDPQETRSRRLAASPPRRAE
jgi:hypothetical protein